MEKAYDHLLTESDWYRRWEENSLFTPADDAAGIPFSIILPPPNVTGSLHIGHALTLSLPDIIVRRKKMQGFNVLWLPGVDHAGIATQMMVEKNLKKEKGLSKEDSGPRTIPAAGLGLEKCIAAEDRGPDQKTGVGTRLDPDEIHPERRNAAGGQESFRRCCTRKAKFTREPTW